jgi:methylenetetrahydrofolate reductase (NADPH)
MRAKTRLAQKLGSGKPALTAECLPPAGADAAAVRHLARSFAEAIDAVVVADHPESVQGSALACAALLCAERVEAMLTLVTRDRNRIALQSDVLGAAALGVRSFLCVAGTHQALGASPCAAGSYDLDSIQLSQALARLADEGVGFGGEQLGAPPSLFVAATAHPGLRPAALGLLQTKKKVTAGAQALFTDPVTDVSAFAAWMEGVRATGLERRVAIIASLGPERAELAGDVLRIPGVRGIHILSGGHETELGPIIRQVGFA